MIQKGDTFLLKNPPKYDIAHLYIAISDPLDNKIIVVNVTKKRAGKDCTCELNVGDHRFIITPSIINYADAKDLDHKKLEEYLEAFGDQENNESVSPELLLRIVEGVHTSESFPPKYLKYFPPP
jgi:hypothetical protein